MNVCIFYILAISALCATVQPFNHCPNGSTPHLKDIIVGRCEQFKKVKDINCTKMWSAFFHGFAYKNSCAVRISDYEPFFDVGSREPISVNKSLFWSRTYKQAHVYSDYGSRYTTLEDTLEGSMMNKLCWCGNPANTSGGINYNSCPDCQTSVGAFWALASKRFAERARGVVQVMLSGTLSDGPAYRNTSIFAQVELPSFNVTTIIKLKILVIHTIGKKPLESCGDGSIKRLQHDARKRNITVNCVNDPPDVRHIQCSYEPNAKECLFRGNAPEHDCRLWETIVIVLAVLLLVTVLALVIVLSILCHKRYENKKKTKLQEY